MCDCLNVSYAAYGLRTCVEAVILVGSLNSFNIFYYFIFYELAVIWFCNGIRHHQIVFGILHE